MKQYTYEKKELLDLFLKYIEEIRQRFSMKNVLFDNENTFIDNILETYKSLKNNITIDNLLYLSSKTCKKESLEKVLSVKDKDLTIAINKTYKEFKPKTFEEVEQFNELVCCRYYHNQFIKNINSIIKYIICSELITYILNINSGYISLYKDISTIELFDDYIDNEVLPRHQSISKKYLSDINLGLSALTN